MVSNIFRTEGLPGFFKGFSAAFYGAAIYGFAYFTIYKSIKNILKSRMGADTKVDMAVCYFFAALSTECLTLAVKFPFDLFKCRLQSVNTEFRYTGLKDAFTKEFARGGIYSLYKGAIPFLATQATFVTLQFSIFERFI